LIGNCWLATRDQGKNWEKGGPEERAAFFVFVAF